MNADDIQQKLALLPEGLVEENIKSWDLVTNACEFYFSHGRNTRWQVLIDLIQKLSISAYTKLYRGGLSLDRLMISTKEEMGLEKSDAYFYIGIKDVDLAEVGYCEANTKEAETFECKNDELFIKIQPFLDRLWNETRRKKNV